MCFAILLKIEEEESLVVPVVQLSQPDGTADIEPIVVFALPVPDVLSCPAGIAGRDSVCEWSSSVQSLVHKVIEYCPMELIRAGLHGVIEIAATSLTKLRGIIAGLNGDFLDGIHARLNALIDLPVHAVGGILAFDANGMRTGGHSVNPELVFVSKTRPRQQI